MNRAEQWKLMKEMINLCQNLNNGSGIVFKICRLGDITKELSRTDFETPECSFVDWVRRKAIEETTTTNQ